MPYNDAGKNAMADGLAAVIAFMSLHNGDPSTTGANELTGGSPAYARKSVTWAAASGGQRASSNAQLFDVAAGVTVLHYGYWSLVTGGTFYGYFPIGGFQPQGATFVASTDIFTSFGHGYANGDRVLVADIQGAGVPAGFTEGTMYHVISATADTFQLSATAGGATVAGTTDGEVLVIKGTPETFGGQGQLSVASGATFLDCRIA